LALPSPSGQVSADVVNLKTIIPRQNRDALKGGTSTSRSLPESAESGLSPEAGIQTKSQPLGGSTKKQSKVSSSKDIIPKDSTKAKPSAKVGGMKNLETEAKKFKTADEFVGSQGTPIFHGTNADFEVFDPKKMGSATDEGLFGRGTYFGNTESFARVAPRGTRAKNVMEVYAPEAKLFDISQVKTKSEMADLLDMSEDALIESNGIVRPMRGQSGQFTSQLKELGYDGVVVHRVGTDSVETVIFDVNNFKTKPQLTDIWNKANKK